MGGKDEKRKPDDLEQSKRFEETARRLETDTSGKVFEKAMEVITAHHPDESDPKKEK